MSQKPIQFTDGSRIHYGGSKRSNVIQNIVLLAPEELEQVTLAGKKRVLGSNRFEVGGKTAGCTREEMVKRDNDDFEPIAYHAMPPKLYSALGDAHRIAGWIDLTCQDPTLAKVAVEEKKMYIGSCCTPELRDWMKAAMTEWAFKWIQDPGCPYFKADLPPILEKIAGEKPASKAKGEAKPKAKGKSAPKVEPKAKPKVKPQAVVKAKAKSSSAVSKLKKQLEALGQGDDEEPEDEDDDLEGEEDDDHDEDEEECEALE